MHGSAPPSGSLGRFSECGAETECAIDDVILVGIVGAGIDYAIDDEVESDL